MEVPLVAAGLFIDHVWLRFAALFAGIFALMRFWARWSAVRTIRKAPIWSSELQVELGEEGLSIQAPLFNSTTKWDAIVRAVEGRDHFLLLMSPETFYCLPKRVLTATDVESARALIAMKVSARAL